MRDRPKGVADEEAKNDRDKDQDSDREDIIPLPNERVVGHSV